MNDKLITIAIVLYIAFIIFFFVDELKNGARKRKQQGATLELCYDIQSEVQDVKMLLQTSKQTKTVSRKRSK